MLVRSRMTADVYTASPDTTIAEALGITRTHRIRHLPILRDGELVGLVTDRDLRLAMPPMWADDRGELLDALHSRRIGDLMTTDLITAPSDMPVEDAAKLLYTHRIGCLPIMENGKLVGILTETDLLRAFAELFASRAPSVRLEVQMPNRPGELARVVRLIGIENRINIAGIVVPPLKASDESVAIMHLQIEDAAQIAHALRRIGYRVGTPSLESDPLVDFVPTEEYESRGGDPATSRAMAEL